VGRTDHCVALERHTGAGSRTETPGGRAPHENSSAQLTIFPRTAVPGRSRTTSGPRICSQPHESQLVRCVTYTLQSVCGRNTHVYGYRRACAVRPLAVANARSDDPGCSAGQAAPAVARSRGRQPIGRIGTSRAANTPRAGYRIYYAWDGPDRVLLLGGGSKATQAVDIATASAHLVAHRKESRR
jgi:hypothetical protein